MDNLTTPVLNLDAREFRRIAELVYGSFGIHLTEKKHALVRGRLHSLIRSLDLGSFEAYIDYLTEDGSGARMLQLVDRISTNHTYFFREADHFDYLTAQVVPRLLEEKGRDEPIRIWCAGCASGEEPYTIAMVLHHAFPGSSTRFKILATDISVTALEAAKNAVYPRQKAAGVPKRFERYFESDGPERLRVTGPIREAVLFKRLNLMRESLPFTHGFDVLFCRNVMIYFDQPTRISLVSRFHRALLPGGVLFIGHSETLGRETSLFRYLKPTVYARNRDG